MITVSINFDEVKTLKSGNVFDVGLDYLKKIQNDPFFDEMRDMNYQSFPYGTSEKNIMSLTFAMQIDIFVYRIMRTKTHKQCKNPAKIKNKVVAHMAVFIRQNKKKER